MFKWLAPKDIPILESIEGKPQAIMEKKCCVKFKDEEWQPARVDVYMRRYLTRKEKKGVIYAKEFDLEAFLNIEKVVEKAME